MPSDQANRADTFRQLHEHERPLLLANAWSAASARVAEAAGAAAIGTTSFGMALDHGRTDGQLPYDTALMVAEEIARSVEVPVTVDLEAGRGDSPDDVRKSMTAVIATGAVGVNIEDSVPGEHGTLFDVASQAERLRAARAAAEDAGVPMYINARCDVFFGADVAADRAHDEVAERAGAYKDAGADGLFLPGLLDVDTIKAFTSRIKMPLNVMVLPGLPSLDELIAAGVKRISQGGASFIAAAGALHTMTAAYVNGELVPPADAIGAGFPLVPVLAR